MKNLIKYIFIFSFVFSTMLLKANSFADSVSKANALYQDGKYSEAVIVYENVINSGFEADDLYYNLGNAYFKNKDLPHAIWYYEKTLKHNPSHTEAQFNLNVANARIVDKIEPLPEVFYMRWWKSLINMFPLKAWSVVLIFNLIILLGFIGWYLFSKRPSTKRITFFTALFMLFLLITGFTFAYGQLRQHRTARAAIVFTPSVTAKSSPDEKSIDLFVLHEGTKVWLLDKLGEWTEIKIANGNRGWIRIKNVKDI